MTGKGPPIKVLPKINSSQILLTFFLQGARPLTVQETKELNLWNITLNLKSKEYIGI